MCKFDQTAVENVQQALARKLPGPSSSLTYRARCKLLGLETLLLSPLELNTAFIFIICHNNAHSAANVKHNAGSLPCLVLCIPQSTGP